MPSFKTPKSSTTTAKSTSTPNSTTKTKTVKPLKKAIVKRVQQPVVKPPQPAKKKQTTQQPTKIVKVDPFKVCGIDNVHGQFTRCQRYMRHLKDTITVEDVMAMQAHFDPDYDVATKEEWLQHAEQVVQNAAEARLSVQGCKWTQASVHRLVDAGLQQTKNILSSCKKQTLTDDIVEIVKNNMGDSNIRAVDMHQLLAQ